LGRRLLQDSVRLGAAVETAFFKHVFTRYYSSTPRFSYWQDKRNRNLEVDLIAEVGDRLIPFEVKYRMLTWAQSESTVCGCSWKSTTSTPAMSSPGDGRT